MHSGAPAAAAAASSPSIRQEASCGRPDLLSGACGGASTSRRSSSSSSGSNSGSNSSSISSSVLVRKSTLSSIIVVHDYDGRRRSSTMTTTTTTKRKGTTSSSSFESQTNDGASPGLASPLASPSCATTTAEATKTNGANSLVAAAAESLHESANEAGHWQVFSRAAANRQQPQQQQQRQPAEVVATVGVESLLSSSRAIPTARATGNQRHNQQQSVAETDLANNCCGDGELDENEENAKFTFCSPTKSKQQQHQEQEQQQRHQQERRQQQSSEREQGNMNRVSPLAARASNKSTISNDYSNTEARYYHAKQVIVVDSSPDLGDDDDDDDVHNYAGYEANRTPTDYSAAPMDSSTATTSCYSPSASITQTNRANFYNNLFNQANDSAGRGQLKHNSSHSNYNNSYVDTPENILLFATEHYVGRPTATTSPPIAPNNGNNNNAAANGAERQQHQRGRLQQVGRGQQQLMTKSKSATLPNNNSNSNFDLDYSASNYYEIKPTTATNNNNNNNASKGTTDGRHQPQQTAAIRSSTRSISSPRGGSIKLATKATTSTVGGRGGTDCNSQYGPLGSESQRASRLSLHATTPTRMGKFVNYYPATRQPHNGGIAGSPSHKRHTSPYAFHVPLYRQQQQQQRSYHRAKSPLSPQHQLHYTNQPSVSYMYVNDGNDEQQIVLAEEEREAVSTEVKQPRYGYVAPIDRLESRQQLASSSDQLKQQQQHQKQLEQLIPVGKFNKTLRSRTIAHIPGMVQVSVDDNCLQTQSPLKRQRQMGGDLIGRSRDAPPPMSRVQPLMASNSGVDDSASDYYYNAINLAGRSEGDLLKAHKIAWRHSNKFEFGYDNPFKPGTELSWEADLMVRLIKRGYPIDALPNLVQATKEVRDNQQYQYQSERNASQARSKSCDKLATSNDMRTGRRREQSDASPAEANAGVDARVKQQQQQQNQKSGGYLKSNIRQFNKTAASGPRDKLDGDDSEEASSKRRTILDELEPCKRVWANSLSRAKSVPRFYSYSSTTSDSGGTSKPGAVRKTTVAGGSGDADSLDKLITSIEQEIGDLLRERSQVSPDSGIKATGSMSTNESDEDCTLISRIDSGGPGDGAKERPSLKEAIKSKKRPSQTMSGSKSAQSFGASSPPPPIATRRGKRNQKQDLTSSKSSNELLLIPTDKSDNSSGAQSGEVVLVRKKKSRCCMIQ